MRYNRIAGFSMPAISLLFFFLFLSVLTISAQCMSENDHSSSTGINNTSTGSIPFVNTSNIASADGNRAVASATLSILGSAKTNYLQATNFNFSIPSEATICGITVKVRKRATGINILNSIADEKVRLIVGGIVTGNNNADPSNWTNSDSYTTYGDLWGVSLTPVQVNASDFGVAFSASYSGLAGVFLTAEVDYISITVHYSIALPLRLINFTAGLSNSIVNLKWTTVEEEDNSFIVLQRSGNGQEWQDIHTWSLHNNYSTRNYQYSDAITSSAYYRLKLIQATGPADYSDVRMIQYTKIGSLQIFPNPCRGWIKIENQKTNEPVRIFNSNGRIMTITGSNLQLNLQHLAPGVYFLQNGTGVLAFIKQ